MAAYGLQFRKKAGGGAIAGDVAMCRFIGLLLPWVAVLSAAAGPVPYDAAALRRVSHGGDARLRHAGQLTAIVLLPDGRRALTAAQDHTARIWDLETGKEIRRFEAQASSVWTAAILPDGDRVLLGDGGRVSLRHIATGEESASFDCFGKEAVFRISLVSDGRRFAAAGKADVRLWDIAEAKEIRAYPGFTKSVYAVAATPDGRLLAAGGEEKAVRVWETGPGQLLWTLAHEKEVYTVSPSPDGKRLASCGNDNAVRLWDLESGRELWKAAALDNVKIAGFSADGRRLAAGAKDRLVVLDAADGKVIRTIATPGETHWPVAFTADGRSLYSGSDGAIWRWDLESGRRVWPAPDAVVPVAPPEKAAYDAKGGRILVAKDKALGLWSLRDGRAAPANVSPEDIRGLAVAPDGQTALVSCQNNLIRVFDLQAGRFSDGREVRIANTAGRIAFTADGRSVAVLCPSQVLVYRADLQGDATVSFESEGSFNDLAISPAGPLAATAGSDGRIRFWNLDSGAEVNNLRAVDAGESEVHSKDPERCVFSADGGALLVSTDDKRLCLWLAPGAAGAEATPEAIRRWLDDLGADDFNVREAATERLMAAGERARRLLEGHDARGSAEIAGRLRLILGKLAIGRLPVEPAGTLTLDEEIRDIALLPDNRHWAAVAGSGARGQLVIGETAGGALREIRRIADGSGTAFVFASPDGKALYTVNRDGTVAEYGWSP